MAAHARSNRGRVRRTDQTPETREGDRPMIRRLNPPRPGPVRGAFRCRSRRSASAGVERLPWPIRCPPRPRPTTTAAARSMAIWHSPRWPGSGADDRLQVVPPHLSRKRPGSPPRLGRSMSSDCLANLAGRIDIDRDVDLHALSFAVAGIDRPRRRGPPPPITSRARSRSASSCRSRRAAVPRIAAIAPRRRDITRPSRPSL